MKNKNHFIVLTQACNEMVHHLVDVDKIIKIIECIVNGKFHTTVCLPGDGNDIVTKETADEIFDLIEECAECE